MCRGAAADLGAAALLLAMAVWFAWLATTAPEITRPFFAAASLTAALVATCAAAGGEPGAARPHRDPGPPQP